MNYLAHLYLSGDNAGLITGNFIADEIKGKQITSFPDEIIRGIKLHRFIDSFTDTHPVVEKSKERLRPTYRKYSSVIVDIYYDHFLAVNWGIYSKIPLNQYVDNIYSLLQKDYDIFPSRMKAIFLRMIKQNWLLNYKEKAGIEIAFQGLARRTTFPSRMEYAGKELIMHYADFEEEFRVYFPLLVENVKKFIRHA